MATEATELSDPRVAVSRYTIYPKGYNQSTLSGKNRFCVYVEQYADSGRWYIHGGDRWSVSTHKAKWVFNTPLNRRWTRFDTAEDAIRVALKAVETRGEGRNLTFVSKKFDAWIDN